MNHYAYANGNPVSYVDPEGTFANFIIGGAIGGAIGGVAGGAIAYWSSGGDWKAARAGAIGGAISGAMVGSGGALIAGALQAGTMTTGAALAAGSGLGAVGGASGNVAQQLSGGASLSNLDYRQVGVAGTVGAAFGGLGSAATVVSNGVQTSSAAIMQQMQRNLISYETQFVAEGASQAIRQSVSQSVMSGMASVGASRAFATSAIWTADQLAMPFVNQATETFFVNQLPASSGGSTGRK